MIRKFQIAVSADNNNAYDGFEKLYLRINLVTTNRESQLLPIHDDIGELVDLKIIIKILIEHE